jgi:hypothetical protein
VLPLEYADRGHTLASVVGQVLSVGDAPPYNPRFCVGLDLEKSWVSLIHANRIAGYDVEIFMDYDLLNVRCTKCLEFSHPANLCLVDSRISLSFHQPPVTPITPVRRWPQ